MTTNTNNTISLKGSKFCGEMYPKSDGRYMTGFIYRLANGGYALVKKEEYSGRILEVSALDPKSVRRFKALNLGYNIVNMYCPKEAA